MVGWYHSQFGKLAGEDVETLLTKAVLGALDRAAIAAEDVDAVFVGHFNSGLSSQGFTAALVANAHEGFRQTPSTRVENACATGSAALYQGIAAIEAGQARVVLVAGVEKMTDTAAIDVGPILLKASYLEEENGNDCGFPGVFARVADAYFQQYGDQSNALASIAAKNHHNGCSNPYAHLRKDLGFDFCATTSERNPVLAGPLRRTDCSPISDGAAAIVLMAEDDALALPKAIRFKAAVQTSDYLPLHKRSELTELSGCREAWRRALERSGLSLLDLDLVETHDCFTIAELLQYEAMNLTGPGQGPRAIMEGWTTKNGRLPVNPSGGLKSKGHPIGATGVSMHIMAAKQLCDEAGGMQIAGARLAGVFNMGGVAVANYCSILEPV